MAANRGIRIHQYLDDWLVRARSQQICLQHTQTLIKMCQDLGWLVNIEKSELEPKQVFDFVGYQFDLRSGRVRPTPDRWQNLQDKIQALLLSPACPVRQLMSLIGLLTATEKQVHLGRLHMRPIQWHLKNNLENTGILGENYSPTQVSAPSLTMVARGKQCAPRPTFTPNKTCSANLYRRVKRRVGRSFKRIHGKRVVVGAGKQAAHKLSGTQSGFPSLKGVPKSLCKQDSSSGNRQHHSCSLHKQRRRHEIGPLCALLWRILTWCSQRQVTLKARHIPGRLNVIVDKLSRLGQTIQTEWSLLPEVFQTVCNQWHRPQIDLFATRFNHKLPQFVSPVPDSLAVAVDALTLPWEDLDAYAFPPTAILGKVVEKLLDSPCRRANPNCSRMAQHAWFWDLVAMSSQVPLSLPHLPNLLTQPFNQIPHRKSDKPESSCLAPRATAIKEQGFSEAVAARIEAPQRRSTRSVYEAKWTIFTKWCITNQVDFRSPPVKSVADFLLYLFEVKNLQPSTIDGYRSAMRINWVIPQSISAKMIISLVSWTVSTETGPRGGGAYPPGTFRWYYTSSQRPPLNLSGRHH